MLPSPLILSVLYTQWELHCTSGRAARWKDRQGFSEVSYVWILLQYKNLGVVLGAVACLLEKSTCKHAHNAPASKADRNMCTQTTYVVERKGTQTNSPGACLRMVWKQTSCEIKKTAESSWFDPDLLITSGSQQLQEWFAQKTEFSAITLVHKFVLC